jgi:hypothetical protein
MQEIEAIVAQIAAAFARVPYPGDHCLRNSGEGDEPHLLEEEFKGKSDWRTLDSKFLDQAPDGYATALSFFTHEAFRFYLPAYLIADLRGQLQRADPVFYLTHGLDESSRAVLINPNRYGEQTWLDYARERFAAITRDQAQAIVSYLKWKRDTDSFGRTNIEEALDSYWSARV